MSQLLRRSQFITTYGPGAILEGPEGPRMIPTLGNSGLFTSRRPADFEITDRRLSRALLHDAHIVRLPSNAEIHRSEQTALYDTESFPRWALCTRHQILYLGANGTRACPRCPAHPDTYKAWNQAHRQALRFVRACPAGHLDDVHWKGMIQHTREGCDPPYLLWQGGGGALRHIDIVCPSCRGSVNLGTAYAREWTCTGRFPERGKDRPGCNRHAKIIQRGAANLHIAELQSALTIPLCDTTLHRLLEMSTIRAILVASRPTGKADLVAKLRALVDAGLLRRAILMEIDTYPEDTLMAAIGDVLTAALPDNGRRLRLQEFEALTEAASRGAPALLSATPGAPPQFEVLREQVRQVIGPGGRRLRVTPVNRLRVVMVQTGYRRMIHTEDMTPDELPPLVDCVYHDGEQDWYPGVELFGEGIFLDLAPDQVAGAAPGSGPRHFPLGGTAATTWFDAWIDPASVDLAGDSEEREHLHPVFVWWHTLAHRLITALAVDSGYSSAAVRERVFVNIDESTGDASGGILLYTTQPGGDGTLGGLVGLVPEFERVLATALGNIDLCSNDPLCSEETFGAGKYNGAACYACALVSETSCEHRNMRLDRNLLLDNLP